MNKLLSLFDEIDNNIDCVLITSDINRRYFSQMKSSAGLILAFREKAYFIIDFRYIEKAHKIVKNCEVLLWNNIKEQVCELLSKHNAKTMAVESETMSLDDFNKYKKMFSHIEIDASNTLSKAISKLRIVKTKDEIEKIIKAQRIAESAFDNVLNFIKEGVSEREISLELDFFMLKNGAEATSFDTIALSGRNTSLPHGVPSDKKIKLGEFVLMDFGAVFEGYHSDMTRTVCVGKPSDEMEKVYDIVLNAQNEAINAVKSGVSGKEIDAIARNYIKNAGYGKYFGHGLGHGVGMEIHELPNANTVYEENFEENMVVTIEPGIYIPEKFGVRIEDFVVVTNDFCANLTKTQKNLICL